MKVSKHVVTSCIVAASAVAGLGSAYADSGADPTDVPQELVVPAHQTLAFQALGVGVQNYRCAASTTDPQQYGWVFMSPEATLFAEDRHRIGIHYGGPTWEAKDGSKIVGTVKAHVDSPSKGAIPWLLLEAKPIVNQGVFGQVRYVQRLHTSGGVVPSMPCNASSAGRIARVPYSADYYFYEPQTRAGAVPATRRTEG
ncbi:exported protein of unknown function [Pararobbsia alpina]|uniref:DUF3455 domain-containing protein n=1 Tax=Pararobbsia alpina TaxID=621374 RepID=UPI0039A54130